VEGRRRGRRWRGRGGGGGGEGGGGVLGCLERDRGERRRGIRTIFWIEIPYINFPPNQQNQIRGKAVLFAIMSGASYYRISWLYPFQNRMRHHIRMHTWN